MVLFGFMIGIPARLLGIAVRPAFWKLSNAFPRKERTLQSLVPVVTSLPVQWHKDHHSGQIINRVRKS